MLWRNKNFFAPFWNGWIWSERKRFGWLKDKVAGSAGRKSRKTRIVVPSLTERESGMSRTGLRRNTMLFVLVCVQLGVADSRLQRRKQKDAWLFLAVSN